MKKFLNYLKDLFPYFLIALGLYSLLTMVYISFKCAGAADFKICLNVIVETLTLVNLVHLINTSIVTSIILDLILTFRNK